MSGKRPTSPTIPLEEQLRSKNATIQELLHRSAIAESRSEALLQELISLRGQLFDQRKESDILRETVFSLSDQLAQRTFEIEASQAHINECNQQYAILQQSLEEAARQMQQMQNLIKIKDERVATLQERLSRFEKVAVSPTTSNERSQEFPVRRLSGGTSNAAIENGLRKIMRLPFGTRSTKLEDELVRATEALMAHQSQNALLSEELFQLRAKISRENSQEIGVLSGSLSGSLSETVSPQSDQQESPFFQGEEGQAHVHVGFSDQTDQRSPSDLYESLKEAIDEHPFQVLVSESDALNLPGIQGLITLDATWKPDTPCDRYGFVDEDISGSVVNGVLMKQLKRHFESRHAAAEELQRARFESYMTRRGLRYDALVKTDELKLLIRNGIPIDFRSKLWVHLSGAAQLREPGAYQKYLKDNENKFSLHTQQIELDVQRTLPTNKYFSTFDAPGIQRLRRLLVAYSWRNKVVGYCQGMNMLAAPLLLVLEEEDAFWTLARIVEDILPQNYFTSNLLVSQADQRVLKELVAEKRPRLIKHLDQNGVDLTLITFTWFLTAFVDCCPPETIFRIWDCFLFEGTKVLFRFAMGTLRMHEESIMQLSGSSALFNYLKNMTTRLFDVDELAKNSFAELNPFPSSKIEHKREKHTAAVRAEQAALEAQRATLEKSVVRLNIQDDED